MVRYNVMTPSSTPWHLLTESACAHKREADRGARAVAALSSSAVRTQCAWSEVQSGCAHPERVLGTSFGERVFAVQGAKAGFRAGFRRPNSRKHKPVCYGRKPFSAWGQGGRRRAGGSHCQGAQGNWGVMDVFMALTVMMVA